MRKLIDQIKLKLATLAVVFNPNFATAWKMKGATEQSLFRYTEAIDSYNQYIFLCPQDFAILTVVGALLNGLGQPEKAIGFFNRAIAIHPDYTPAILNKGYAYSRLAKFEEAISCYDEVLLVDCYLAAYNKPLDATIHHQAWINRGHAFWFLGDEDTAVECYLQANQPVIVDKK